MPPTTATAAPATTAGPPDTIAALAAAASLLSTAAVCGAAVDTEHVSVTICLTGISVQIGQHVADETARTAIVAAHARVLATTVARRRTPHSPHTWIETRGVLAGHPVHVWTIADPDPDPARAEVS
jgi:hypothetical protein